jgi:hypothetical protein
MNQDQMSDEDEAIDINDPRLPDALREHGKRFHRQATLGCRFGRRRILVVFRRLRTAGWGMELLLTTLYN